MKHRPWRRDSALLVAGVLLIWLGWKGLSGGFQRLWHLHTPGQKVQTVAQPGYGLFAVLSLVTQSTGNRPGTSGAGLPGPLRNLCSRARTGGLGRNP